MQFQRKYFLLLFAFFFTGLGTSGSALSKVVSTIILVGTISLAIYYRAALLEKLELYNEKLSLKINSLSENGKLPIPEWFFEKYFVVYLISAFVFVFHFWFQWVFGRNVVLSGTIHIVLDPLNFLLQNSLLEALSYRHFQINSYTGNPFFLLPIMLVMGYTPESLRIALILVFALTMMIIFLVYYEVLDLKKAILGVLILSSMGRWVTYKWPDYDYTILFFSILLLIYFKWMNEGGEARSRYVYLMSFLSGFFFYFKATTAYMLISLGAAAVYKKKGEVISFIKQLNMPALLMLFLIGLSPFLAYNAIHTDTLVRDGFSFGGPEDIGFTEVPVERFEQLDHWLRTDAGRITDSSSSSFSETSQPLSPFNSFHLFSILILVSIPSLLIAGKHVQIPIIFVVFYILMFFLPVRSGVWMYQLTVLVPLVPLLVVAMLDIIPDKIRGKMVYKMVFAMICLVFAVGIHLHVSELSNQDPPTEDSFNVNYWAGDQKYYNQFEELNISEPVVTNSYKAHIITKYFFDIKTSDYLLPTNTSKKEYSEMKDTGRKLSLIKYYSVPVNKWKIGDHSPIDTSEKVTLILRKELPCKSVEEVCGASIDQIVEEFGLDKRNMEKIELGNKSYYMIKKVRIES